MYVQGKTHPGGSPGLKRSCRHWKTNVQLVVKLIERSHTSDRRKTKRRVPFLALIWLFLHSLTTLTLSNPSSDARLSLSVSRCTFRPAIRIRAKNRGFWIIVIREIRAGSSLHSRPTDDQFLAGKNCYKDVSCDWILLRRDDNFQTAGWRLLDLVPGFYLILEFGSKPKWLGILCKLIVAIFNRY